MAAPKRIIVAITGASGAFYAKRILEALCTPPTGQPGQTSGGGSVEVFLIVSTYGRRLLHDELGLESGGPLDMSLLAGRTDHGITLLPYKDVGAAIASGSFKTDGMVVVPCSNNKLAEIAHGIGDNLIARAANVCLKERRRLVLVHREMPLGLIEIKNMLAVTEAGAIVCPANPGFYHLPATVDEVIDTVAARVLDLLDVPHGLGKRWTEKGALDAKATELTGQVVPQAVPVPVEVLQHKEVETQAVPPEVASAPATVQVPQAGMGEVKPVPLAIAAEPPTVDPPVTGPLPPLLLDTRIVPVEAHGQARPEPRVVDVPANTNENVERIEARCRLKAEAARWAAEKQRHPDSTHFKMFLEKPLQELVARAKQIPQCFLWMVHRHSPAATAEPEQLERAAACFETLGEALELVRETLAGERAGRLRPLELLAEAQASLRAAATACGIESDTDQYEAFEWLREITQREQIQVRRFMRLIDQPEPGREQELRDQIRERRKEISEARRRVKLHDAARKQIKYHRANLLDEPEQAHAHDWRKIGEAVEKLRELGLTVASPELHALLAPIAEHVPSYDELSPGLREVFEEMERAPAAAEPETVAARAYSAEVARVARLLSGKSVVLIGGDPRPQARQSLMRAFGLEDLIWIKSREHQSTASFEAPVARPEVALVLLAIRWSGHAFSDAKVFCERHGKPLVRLPGGYSVNQVAAQVAQQCSARLATAVGGEVPALEGLQSGA